MANNVVENAARNEVSDTQGCIVGRGLIPSLNAYRNVYLDVVMGSLAGLSWRRSIKGVQVVFGAAV